MRLKAKAQDHVRTVEHVDLSNAAELYAAIRRVIAGETLVLTTSLPHEIIEAAVNVVSSAPVTPYAVEPAFAFGSRPLFETDENDPELLSYFAEGSAAELELTQKMSPFPTPSSIIEGALGAAWPAGVERLQLDETERRCPWGLVRHLSENGELFYHADCPDLDRADLPPFQSSFINLAIVCYVRPAESGGELQVAPHCITNADEIDRLRLPGHAYALRADLLPEPVTIRPVPGLAALWNARNVHRVLKTYGSQARTTISGFALFRGPTCPLSLYY